MYSRRLVTAALAAVLLAGCGSSSSSSSSATGPRSWTLAQILRLTGMRRNADGLSYSLPASPQCPIRVMLRSTAEVQTYKNAGDPIATNPDKSAGAVVDPGVPRSCQAVFTKAFAKVR